MRLGNALNRRALLLSMLFTTALGPSGCGPTGPALVPVEGKVTLTTGKPVTYGHVILHPDVARGNTSKEVCQGTIQDGGYLIMTGAKYGAPLGPYKVAIEAGKADPQNPYITEWIADEKYINPNQSGLQMEVVENAEAGRYDFRLEPHRARRKK